MRRILCFGLVSAITVAACAAKQDIVNSVPDVAGCIESAVTTFVTGTPDVAGLIAHCGATLTDIEKVITDLESNQDAGTVAAYPERAAKIKAWKDAVAKYRAEHPHAK